MATTISGTSGVTYPAGGTDNVAGSGVGTTDTQTLTNKTLTSPTINSPTITGAVVSSMASSVITSGTAVASTSGTSIDFTSIPSWVKRITVMFYGVSTSGTADVIIQLGTGATPTYTTSGYLGSVMTTTGSVENFTSGFKIINGMTAASIVHGSVVITNVTGNTWSETTSLGYSDRAANRLGGGSIPLAAALTAVRITTSASDTFDAGSINILYE